MNHDEEAPCFGCILANGGVPAYVVYENETITCLLDHDPYEEGHILILPKTHYRYLDEFDDGTALAMLHAAQTVSAAIRTLYSPFGITQVQNGGGVDDLTHFHLHVVQRTEHRPFQSFYNDDELNNAQLKAKLPETRQQLVLAIQQQLALLPRK